VIFSIDHIVFAASREQSQALRERLALAGFEPERFHLEFPEIGAASDSMSYEGGGFVEFVVELDPERSPRVWFDDAPRIIGLGLGSDSFEQDTLWSRNPGGWAMDEDHTLSDGSRLNVRAAGPHEHLSDFYIFVMDRPERTLQFSEHAGSPRLKRLTFAGAAADRWKENVMRWLELRQDDIGLRVGDVELWFTHGAHPSIRVSATFDVASGSGVVALAGSSLELKAL
jgi:hypothetical protein